MTKQQGSWLSRRTLSTRLGVPVTVLALAFLPVYLHARDKKLKPEELIERHLQSLGSPEALAAIKTRNAQGRGQLSYVTGGTGSLIGPVTFLSDQDKFRLSVRFDYPQFPGMVVSFDGKKHHVPKLNTDNRLGLGEFLYRFNIIIKEGLLGGALSTAWPLLHLEERRPKLKSHGVKKVGEERLFRLEYRPRKSGGGLKINLYFDPETLRHVLTIYQVVNRFGMRASASASLGGQESIIRLTLVERFGAFRKVDGVEVPTSWNLRYTEQRQEGEIPAVVTTTEWALSFLAFTHNQPMDPSSFVTD